MTSDADQQRIGHSVGAELRAARLARKFTQSQLARPDFSVSYVSAIERGQIHPSLRALEIFAQRLGIASSDLLSKQSMQESNIFSDKDAANENKVNKALQLLEAQILIHQGNERQAMMLLRNLAYEASKAEQTIQQRFLLGWAFYLSGYLQESESVLAEALSLVNEVDDFWLKHILNVLGMVHTAIHNHTQGFEYQLRILAQVEKGQQPHDVFLEAQVYTNIGLHYLDLDKNDDAIEMFQHALSRTNVLSPDQLSSMYSDMSRYLTDTQHFFLATLYSYKSLQMLYQEYTDALRSELYHFLGQAMLRQEQQNTLHTFEEFLQDVELKKDTLALASVTDTIAAALFQKGEVKKAYEYAQNACKLALPYGDSIVTASIYITLGRIDYARKDYKEGDKYFVEGLGILERLGTREEFPDQAAHYAQLLEERKMPNEALRYYKKAYENSRERE